MTKETKQKAFAIVSFLVFTGTTIAKLKAPIAATAIDGIGIQLLQLLQGLFGTVVQAATGASLAVLPGVFQKQ